VYSLVARSQQGIWHALQMRALRFGQVRWPQCSSNTHVILVIDLLDYCKPAEKQRLHCALQTACSSMAMPTPLTLLDRTSKQSHTGTLSSLAFIYAVLQLICMTCLSVHSSLLRTLLTRTPARFRAFQSYLFILDIVRRAPTLRSSLQKVITRGAGFMTQVHCYMSARAKE